MQSPLLSRPARSTRPSPPQLFGLLGTLCLLAAGGAPPAGGGEKEAGAPLVEGVGEEATSWYPSRYGAEDTLGAINELSPEKVLEAAQLIRSGKTYSLGIETGPDTPAYPPRNYQIAILGGDGAGGRAGSNHVTGNDDLVVTWLGVGTQLDGLGHVGIDYRYYNGLHASEFVRPDGLVQLGTHLLPPIVTRGLLIDIAALRGVEILETGSPIGAAELRAAVERQDLAIRPGDVVLLHTGWGAMATRDPKAFMAGEPGLSVEGARYLADFRPVAVGSDTWGLEALPTPSESEGQLYPVHQLLLAQRGIYILENIRTDELAADGAAEFLFVLGQPKFVGAVQVVINPVAIR